MSFSVDLTTKSSEMQPINSWRDVTLFAGRIVAYKTDSFSFEAFKGFFKEDESIQFGYIDESTSDWVSREKGYRMQRLLKPEEESSNCALIDSELKSSISMRLASSDEITLLRNAILTDQAVFEYFEKEEAIKLLTQPYSKVISEESKKEN